MGFIGSATATSLSVCKNIFLIFQRVLQPLMLFLYIYIKKLHAQTWFGWSKEMWNPSRLKTYLKFGISSGLMIVFEVWGFEVKTWRFAGDIREIF